MKDRATHITALSKLLLGTCALVVFFVFLTLGRSNDKAHLVLRELLRYWSPTGVDMTYMNKVDQSAKEIVGKSFPAQQDIYRKLLSPKVEMITLKSYGDPDLGVRDKLSPPKHYLSIPFLIMDFNKAKVGAVIDYLNTKGQEDAVVSVPDLAMLYDSIAERINTSPSRFYEAVISVSTNKKFPINQVLSYQVDTVPSIGVEVQVKFYAHPFDDIKGIVAYETPVEELSIPMLHQKVPGTSFKDYMGYQDESSENEAASFDHLITGLDSQSEAIKEFRGSSLYDAIRGTDPNNAEEGTFSFLGFTIRYSWFAYLVPLILIILLYLLFVYVKETISVARGSNTSDSAAEHQRVEMERRALFDRIMPIPVSRKYHLSVSLLWLYMFYLPAGCMLLSVFLKREQFSNALIGFYCVGIVTCYLLAKNIIAQLRSVTSPIA